MELFVSILWGLLDLGSSLFVGALVAITLLMFAYMMFIPDNKVYRRGEVDAAKKQGYFCAFGVPLVAGTDTWAKLQGGRIFFYDQPSNGDRLMMVENGVVKPVPVNGDEDYNVAPPIDEDQYLPPRVQDAIIAVFLMIFCTLKFRLSGPRMIGIGVGHDCGADWTLLCFSRLKTHKNFSRGADVIVIRHNGKNISVIIDLVRKVLPNTLRVTVKKDKVEA